MLAQDMRGPGPRLAKPPRESWRLLAENAFKPHPKDKRRLRRADFIRAVAGSPAPTNSRFELLNTTVVPTVTFEDGAIVMEMAPQIDHGGAGLELAMPAADFDVIFEMALQPPRSFVGMSGTEYSLGVGYFFATDLDWYGLSLVSTDGAGAVETLKATSGTGFDATVFAATPALPISRTDGLLLRVKRVTDKACAFFSRDGGVTWHSRASALTTVPATANAVVFLRMTYKTTILAEALRAKLLGVKFLDPRTAMPE